MKTSDQVKPNRYNLRTSKLRALPPGQKQSLIRWLQTDQVTYAAARERLAKEFGVTTSIRALCAFWQSHCAPSLKAVPKTDTNVLLDVVIHPTAPVRLIVQSKGGATELIFKSPSGNSPVGELNCLPTR